MELAVLLIGSISLLASTPGSYGYCSSSLNCPYLDESTHGPEIHYNFCKCRCDGFEEMVVDDLFQSKANCVRIKADGDAKNPGGYLFTMDNFDSYRHDVYHDLWFKRNKNNQRALGGSYWRIYYPWVNASATSNDIPFVVQNILNTQFLSITATAFQNNWKQVETISKLTQKALWNFNTRKTKGKWQWQLQSKKSGEYLIQHATAVGEHWWQGRIFTHDKKKWDGYPDGEWFQIHQCF